MKKLIALITVFCLFFTSTTGIVNAQSNKSTSKPPLSMQILDKKVSTADAPIMKGTTIYLPIRIVGEALGYKSNWDAKAKTMELKASGSAIKFKIGDKFANVNGKKTALDSPSILYNGRAYVSLSFVQKNFNYNTTYNKDKNIVTISKKSATSTNTSSGSTVSGSESSKALYILGKKAADYAVPIVKDGKVYIPLRPIGEGLLYTVSWDAKTSQMELKKTGNTLKITIGSIDALVDNKNVKLDAAPLLISGRAYVPLTFIQSSFNYDIVYDKNKNIVWVNAKKDGTVPSSRGDADRDIVANIQDIAYDDNGGFPQLNIIGDNPINYNSFSISNPERLVIDIQNAVAATGFESKEINKGGIIRIRIAQYSLEPKIVRIVIDLQDQASCKLTQSNDKKSISLIYANNIQPVSFQKENGKDVLIIKGSMSLDTSIVELQDPHRLVVDIKQAVLANGEQTLQTSASSLVKTVRTGQPEVGTARIVLDLQQEVYYDIKNDGGTAKLYLSSLPFSFVSYNSFYNTSYIDLMPGEQVEYQTSFDPQSRILNIMIAQDLNVELKKYEINDKILEYMEVQKQSYDGATYTTASFKLKDKVSYEAISPATTDIVKLKFTLKAQTVDQLTILIDAGHGGKDPGAIAQDGTKEKDLNLEVAFKLNRKLQAMGFKTIMTRTDDSYVDLASRVNMANQNYVDFFMCIHFNAFNQSANGIETLYYPNTVTADYPMDNKAIAQIFHKELIQALNRSSRGITPRPGLYVLNKTKMPAILAELGFITNPDELSHIKTEDYKDKAASALAASIVKYFKDVQGIDLGIDTKEIYALKTSPSQIIQPETNTEGSNQQAPPEVPILPPAQEAVPNPTDQTDTNKQ